MWPHYEPARWSDRCDGETFDTLPLVSPQVTSVVCRRLVSRRVVGFCRRSVDLSSRRGRRVRGVHSGTIRLVARPLPVSGYHFHRLGWLIKSHRRGRLRLAGKTLYSSNTLWPPPRTYQRDSKAKRATGSEKVTSWFSGWECAIRMMQGLAGSARKQRRTKGRAPNLGR